MDMSAGLHLVNLAGSQTRYNIIGAEMQVVNVELKPGDQVEVSPGAMMHHGPNIYANPHCSCSCARYCTGESNVRMEYENKGSAPETIGLTPVYPAKIILFTWRRWDLWWCAPHLTCAGWGRQH